MKSKFFELDQLKSIEFDITSYCNSGCPICVRHEWGTSDTVSELVLSHLDKKIIFDVADQFENKDVKFHFNGVLGDAMMHPDILEIVNFSELPEKEEIIEKKHATKKVNNDIFS